MKKKVWILIYSEAIDAEMLVAGVFASRDEADKLHARLIESATDDYWDIVERQVEFN